MDRECPPFKDSGYSSNHAPSESTTSVLPASQFLQDRLQERRTRPKRSRKSDMGPPRQRTEDDDIFLAEAEDSRQNSTRLYESSPLTAAPSQYGRSRAATRGDVGDRPAAAARRRQLGVKELGEAMDKLAKENFDLKMHLRHSQDHVAKLQAELEAGREREVRTERVEKEHAELLEINSVLVAELEKRDRAVEEAMDIICELEERVAGGSIASGAMTRSSTALADSGYAGTEMLETVPSSPPQMGPKTPMVGGQKPAESQTISATQDLQGLMSRMTPARPKREPSFVTQKKASTYALRSVYMENAKVLQSVKSFNSLISRRDGKEVGENDGPESPRLSVLSESSFPSIYSPQKRHSPERYSWEAKEEEEAEEEDEEEQQRPHPQSSHARTDSINRVNRWIAERGTMEGTPSKSNNLSSPLNINKVERGHSPSPLRNHETQQDEQYQSLDNAVFNSTPKFHPNDPTSNLDHARSLHKSLVKSKASKSSKSGPHPTPSTSTTGGPIFNTSEPLLPPTPDSASTRMLRTSRSSIADDRSLLDTTPATVKGYDALQPTSQQRHRMAPRQLRSSIELRSVYNGYDRYQNAGQFQQQNADGGDEDDVEERAETSTSSSTPSSSSEASSTEASEDSTEANADSSDEDEHSDSESDDSETSDSHPGPRRRRRSQDYPDGASILHGTPSRFAQPISKEPPALFDRAAISPPLAPQSYHAGGTRRRQSSSDATSSTLSPVLSLASPNCGGMRRPSWGRGETSPRPGSSHHHTSAANGHGLFAAMNRVISPAASAKNAGRAGGVRSPTAGVGMGEGVGRGCYFGSGTASSSGNSSQGTVVLSPGSQRLQGEETISIGSKTPSTTHNRVKTTQTQVQGGVNNTPTNGSETPNPQRLTLGQRTQQLIRRMSNSQSSQGQTSHQTALQADQANHQAVSVGCERRPGSRSQQQVAQQEQKTEMGRLGTGYIAGHQQSPTPQSNKRVERQHLRPSAGQRDVLGVSTAAPAAGNGDGGGGSGGGAGVGEGRPGLVGQSAYGGSGSGGTSGRTDAANGISNASGKDIGRKNPFKRGGSVRDAVTATTTHVGKKKDEGKGQGQKHGRQGSLKAQTQNPALEGAGGGAGSGKRPWR